MEMMIALFILAVSILGLTAITISGIQANLQNDLRNTAVRLANERAEQLYALPFETIVDNSTTETVKVRGADMSFTVEHAVTPTTTDVMQIVIEVSYDLKGEDHSYSSAIYRHRAL
jgi:Tfp pilus assembly protein PilV